MNKDCLFCKIVKKEVPATIVYEDQHCLAFLDIFPVNKGHVLVIPKKHYQDIYDVSEEAMKTLSITTQRVAKAVKKATGAAGINIGMNNEPTAGQCVFHIHFHVMPRFEGDGFEHWKGKQYANDAEKAAVGEKIKRSF